tara:strand:+ start:428 stop:793 length:366 start_codon:yes stop_codon:yes gene_type:complete
MKPMINFGRADAGIRQLRRGRRDAPTGHNLHESLGKHLGKTQVVHATDMTDSGNVANRPIVEHRNKRLSSMGGLTQDIQLPFTNPLSRVIKLSHHDAKIQKLTDFTGARKTFTSNLAKAGL